RRPCAGARWWPVGGAGAARGGAVRRHSGRCIPRARLPRRAWRRPCHRAMDGTAVIGRAVLRLALAAALAGTTAVAQAAPRIASINVCTDQLLMALADPAQIAGLSPYARDPASSWMAERAKAFRRLSGEAEDVLALRVDAVAAAPFTRRATRAMLARQGV